MSLEEIRKALLDRKLTVVAASTGLHSATLYRIAKGEVNPHPATLQVLINYLQANTNHEKN